MDDTARIQLTITYGQFGEHRVAVAMGISEELRRELMRPLELSNNPYSVLVASPGLFGGKGDALSIRESTLEKRREVAEMIAQQMIPAIVEALGSQDYTDGRPKRQARQAGEGEEDDRP